MLLVAVIDQRVEPVDAFDDHIAAASAVPAIGAAEFDEFLTPEGNATRAPIARANIDFSLIKEFHALSLQHFLRKGSVKSVNGAYLP